MDLAILATLISVFAPLIAALWRFLSLLNRMERAIERGNADRRLLREKFDGALKLHDHRLREIEKALEAALDFSPEFRRGEGSTGASFLNEDS
jgi:hypothetical protein